MRDEISSVRCRVRTGKTYALTVYKNEKTYNRGVIVMARMYHVPDSAAYRYKVKPSEESSRVLRR